MQSTHSHFNGQPPRSDPSWKRWAIQTAGWTLAVLGGAALVLPGPGLLGIVAGLTLLATQYAWAERLLRPIKAKAVSLEIKGVQTWPRIGLSILGALTLAAMGIVWGLRPPAPQWWPLAEPWWLVGGWATGATLIASGAVALTLIGYSFRRFRNPSLLDLQTAGISHRDGHDEPAQLLST